MRVDKEKRPTKLLNYQTLNGGFQIIDLHHIYIHEQFYDELRQHKKMKQDLEKKLSVIFVE